MPYFEITYADGTRGKAEYVEQFTWARETFVVYPVMRGGYRVAHKKTGYALPMSGEGAKVVLPSYPNVRAAQKGATAIMKAKGEGAVKAAIRKARDQM